MSLKVLLGLEGCPLSEQEILFRLAEAQRRELYSIEFPVKGRYVRVTLKAINQQGIMKDYESQYTT